ncbi:hypothetical protein RhiJN_13253 [Ceratobasidium sp. AG-Ba]|nr:hypothetical protein RhiJN_13253 [Ceratobasidium sp. AG-Ba]
MSPPPPDPNADPPTEHPVGITKITHAGGSNETVVTPDGHHADTDVTMTTGDSIGGNAQRGNEVSAGVATAEYSANTQSEISRLNAEVARLRAELAWANQALELSREEARTMREFFNTAQKALEEQRADTKDLREDAATYRRAAQRAEETLEKEREQWRHDRNDYIHQIDELYRSRTRDISTPNSTVPATMPPDPYADPDYYDDDEGDIYDDVPMDPPSQTIAPVGQEALPVTTPVDHQPPARTQPMPPAQPSRSRAPAGAPSNTSVQPTNFPSKGPHRYSGVTRDLPANQRGSAVYPGHGKSVVTYRPIPEVPPVPTGQPEYPDEYGYIPVESLKRRHTGESNSGERYAPRGSPGFGFGRGRGDPHHYRSKSSKKADGANFEDGTLEKGDRWVVNTTNSEGAAMWRARDAQDIHSMFHGPSQTRVDPMLFRVQRGLLRNARLVPPDYWSAAHREVVRMGMLLEHDFNHPIQGTKHVSPGVVIGEHGTLSSTDMAVLRFVQSICSSGQGRTSLAQRVEQIIIDIFSRPGTYERGVALIDASASNDIFNDPLNNTVITDETRVSATHFPSPESVTPIRVIEWLWRTLRVPRSIARVIIKPFYRRRVQHTIATQQLSDLSQSPGVPEDVVSFAQSATATGQLSPARRNFIFQSSQTFAIRDLERLTWADPGQTLWRWAIPASTNPSMTARTQSEVLRADSLHENIGSIQVAWMPDNVRAMFEPRFNAAVTAWNQVDVLPAPSAPVPTSALHPGPSIPPTDDNMDSIG